MLCPGKEKLMLEYGAGSGDEHPLREKFPLHDYDTASKNGRRIGRSPRDRVAPCERSAVLSGNRKPMIMKIPYKNRQNCNQEIM
jgi:hypothetical protein